MLPAEVVRDVPEEEECLPSPLWRKRVNPADYEFGCDEIFVSLSHAYKCIFSRSLGSTVCSGVVFCSGRAS